MDFYSRQRTVPDWHQPLIVEQRALVLGVGGIGCTISRELCRLGVCEVVLVDNDVVSSSNLNRQVLYCPQDVGRRKIDAAIDGLHRDKILTNVIGVNCDAVKEWEKIIQLTRKSTVVFNCIDYGEYFDCCVMSLCVSLGLPYATASSYGHTAIAESFPAVEQPGRGPCWVCNNTPASGEVLSRVTPDQITCLKSLEFLPKDTHMPTNVEVGSSVLSCSLGATLAVGAWLNSLHGYPTPNWTSCNFAMFQMFTFNSEPNKDCPICSNAPRYSPLVRDLFFGTEAVKLLPVNGTTFTVSAGSITNPATQSHVDQARLRLDSVACVDDKRVYLPAMPAAQLEYSASVSEGRPLVEQLTSPMVKCKEGTCEAIRSGGRSSILSVYNGCYRLKGCGNYVDTEGLRYPHPGFPLLTLEAKEDGVEIRGCCFEHTVLDEQYTTAKVQELLAPHEMVVGNVPMGFWKYNIPNEPLPTVGKYCGLFETLGEKRLGSHLIPGLEALVSQFFPAVTQEEVWSLFPVERVKDDQVMPTWTACCTGTNKSSPLDISSAKLPETPPVCSPPVNLSGMFLVTWLQSTFTIREALSGGQVTSLLSLLALLYRRVGWEVGVVKRALEEARINWGYFLDHNPFEPHCNAHPNNYIILPPGCSSLVAPVDFDMSFQEDGFFSPYTGSQDPSLFQSWLSSEQVELERALAGEMANTGVVMATSQEMSPVHRGLCWGLRDSMLTGYREGYSITNKPVIPDTVRPSVDALVRMALVLTHSETA